jgi:hypothetical protein
LDILRGWQNLSEGQGTVIGAMITLIAAVGGVVLGWLLFSGTARNIETALKETESQVQTHLGAVEAALSGHASQVNEQLTSILLRISQLGDSVADIPTSSPGTIAPAQRDAQDNMREYWTRIRDRLEAIAANPKIDGRTRARYARNR